MGCKSYSDVAQDVLAKAKAARGPYVGPKGGKWADPQHTIPWHEGGREPAPPLAAARDKHHRARSAMESTREKAAYRPTAANKRQAAAADKKARAAEDAYRAEQRKAKVTRHGRPVGFPDDVMTAILKHRKKPDGLSKIKADVAKLHPEYAKSKEGKAMVESMHAHVMAEGKAAKSYSDVAREVLSKAKAKPAGKQLPPGVTDKAAWKKAEEIVRKQHGTTDGKWGLVRHIYDQMTGHARRDNAAKGFQLLARDAMAKAGAYVGYPQQGVAFSGPFSPLVPSNMAGPKAQPVNQNDLPDSAFLLIKEGGRRDARGRTDPRELRKYQARDVNGIFDPALLKACVKKAKGDGYDAVVRKAGDILKRIGGSEA